MRRPTGLSAAIIYYKSRIDQERNQPVKIEEDAPERKNAPSSWYPLLVRNYYMDSAAKPLDGSGNRYTLRFAKGQLPPVRAFWSLTMYEIPSLLLVPNPLKRYLINCAMLPDLKRDPDGGLTIFVQSESPGEDKESNWLPSPNAPFIIVLRLYWPKSEAVDGTWQKPPMEKVREKLATQVA